MKRVTLSIIFLFFLIHTFSQMLPISTKKLIQSSENIVQGKVISTKARWVNNNRYIYTFTQIKVKHSFSGELKRGKTITIVTPGGYDPVKDIGMKVSDQATFETGEEAIVYLVKAEGESDAIDYSFLENDPALPPSIMRINGFFQGKHRIIQDKSTKRKLVIHPNENRETKLSDNKKLIKTELRQMHRMSKKSKK